MSAPLLWTLEETAQVLGGISARTVQRLIAQGELTHVHIGRRVLILASSAQALIDRRMTLKHNEPHAGPGMRGSRATVRGPQLRHPRMGLERPKSGRTEAHERARWPSPMAEPGGSNRASTGFSEPHTSALACRLRTARPAYGHETGGTVGARVAKGRPASGAYPVANRLFTQQRGTVYYDDNATTRQAKMDIRRARLIKHVSQHDLAKAAGIDQGHLSKIENGKVGLSVAQLKRIAKALHVKPADILDSPRPRKTPAPRLKPQRKRGSKPKAPKSTSPSEKKVAA